MLRQQIALLKAYEPKIAAARREGKSSAFLEEFKSLLILIPSLTRYERAVFCQSAKTMLRASRRKRFKCYRGKP